MKSKTKHYERFQKLVNYGYSTKEVLEAEKERQKAKERRDKGLPDLPSTRKVRNTRSKSPVRIVKGLVSGFGGTNNNESNGDDSAPQKSRVGRSRSPKANTSRSRSPVRLVTGLVPGFGKQRGAGSSTPA